MILAAVLAAVLAAYSLIYFASQAAYCAIPFAESEAAAFDSNIVPAA